MYQEPISPIKFRIVEKQFENKSEFHPEWFCDNVNACNHGWNSVHDSNLMTIPTNTYEDSLKRIKWFSNCFQKPLMEVIHEVV